MYKQLPGLYRQGDGNMKQYVVTGVQNGVKVRYEINGVIIAGRRHGS